MSTHDVSSRCSRSMTASPAMAMALASWPALVPVPVSALTPSSLPQRGAARGRTGPMAAVLKQVNLIVADMTATLAFYRRLGVDLPDGVETEVGDGVDDHVEVPMPGGAILEFDSPASATLWHPSWQPDPAGTNAGAEAASGGSGVGTGAGRGRAVLGLELPSRDAVDTAHDDAVAAGATSLAAPHDAFWGSRYAIVA